MILVDLIYQFYPGFALSLCLEYPWILKGSLRFQRCRNVNILDMIPCFIQKICLQGDQLANTRICGLWRLASQKPSEQANIEETLARFHSTLLDNDLNMRASFMCSSAIPPRRFSWIDHSSQMNWCANLIHKPMFFNESQPSPHTIHGLVYLYTYIHLVDCYGK